ncbi:adenylate/guanylate cyclase domain-containing protein [uncultured Shimia sp.]|uniref:ATP-binding protein n=1 Tax=uncultured Shimia sp. TaxID=573152 RepID=UPI0025FD86C4|nr:adenylate/guanylate cyclase domain-containing protein [uncultured Shimia sp.]
MSTDVETGVSDTRGGNPQTSGASEHRSVSVLFADLVGSTERIEEFGAEGYAQLIRRFHTICNDTIRAHGGVVAQYQGDGIICYFGFPSAMEDDAIRTVAAALDICAALTDAGGATAMETRIGIASGNVMIRSDGDDFGANAVGSAINKAARLEALAEAGEIVICHDTQSLVGAFFHARDLGPQTLKGFKDPQPAYRVERRRTGLLTRFEALRGRKLGGLVGRAVEMDVLNSCYAKAAHGAGSGVVISAEAGLGKSRLSRAFLAQDRIKRAASFVLQCSPEHRGTPLYPVSTFLEWIAGTGAHDADAQRHKKLKRLFSKVWGCSDVELNSLLDLLSPLGAETEVDQTESVPLRRGRALSTLADKIFASGAGRDIVIVEFEDAHWIDPTSAMLVEILAGKVADHAALIVLTTRPEPPFGEGAPNCETLLKLNRLSDQDSRELARQSLGSADLRDEQIDEIIAKSDGVPLFLEEYADMLARSGRGEDWKIPLSLAALVQSKLDQLPAEARLLATVGSALGRSFDPAFAISIANLSNEAASRLSEDLIAGTLAERPHSKTEDSSRLMFSHALVQDAIYGVMSSERRRQLHNDIADAFLGDSARISVADHVLANHLARAHRHEEAIMRYMQAALAAAGRGAAFEAMSHLEAGLACIDALPEGEERDRMELQLCAVRGPTQMVTGGPGNPAFGATQERAMVLVDKLGLHATMVPVIYNTALHSWATARLDRAMTIADAIALINEQDASDAAYMAANTMRGLIAWHQGRNDIARQTLSNTIARHNPDLHHDLYALFLKEFGVFSHFYLGLTHSVLGNFDLAREAAETSALLGEAMGFPHGRGFGLLARFNMAMLRNDVDGAEEFSAASLGFATRQGFPEFQAMSQFVQGWAKARRGDLRQGVEQMQGGLEFWAATGFSCWQSHFASYLAQDMVAIGQIDQAEKLVETHLGQLLLTGENQSRAPLMLSRALCQEARGDTPRALETAQEAWYIAAAQGALLWQDMIKDKFEVTTNVI